MTTWTNFPSSGSAVTAWNYDSQRGWLNSKTYEDGHGPSYTYTSAGRLASRKWVRGTNTTYTYNAAGDLASVSYNDSVTPGVTNTYDRLGRLSTVARNGTTTTESYDSANDVLGESYSGGILNGLAVTNKYDSLLRRTNNGAFNGSTLLAQTTNSYDGAGRLSVVSDTTNAATYSYVANSPLVDHILFKHNGTSVMTNQNTYDFVNRLTAKTSGGSGASNSLSFHYQYNNANQRTKVNLADNSYWVYQYDALGQVTNGVKYFYDGTTYAGEQFQYTFDTIGNRTGTQTGGDQSGSNFRQSSYTNNLLNQITSRGVPGDVDVMGLVVATNTVKVNGTNAYQKFDFFREQMATNNSTAAQWVGVNVTAPGQTTVSGHEFLAQNPESFTYDADGNLTQDGRWTYTWDGENRLVNMTSLSSGPAGSLYKLDFTYDAQGRRIQKVASTNLSGTYSPAYTNRFLHDGWNVVAVTDQNDTVLESFTWGANISGSTQGAGGVGGLLSMAVYGGANAGSYVYCYDGNGDVMALINASSGAIAAQYEYGPFGELVRATGPMATINPFLSSTKYRESESGFSYYGYRYYNPSMGKWLSRDPAEEDEGGPPLYGFVQNDPVDRYDALGLLSTFQNCTCCQIDSLRNHAVRAMLEIDTLTADIDRAITQVHQTPSRYPSHTEYKLRIALDHVNKAALKVASASVVCNPSTTGHAIAKSNPYGNTITVYGQYWLYVDIIQDATLLHEATHMASATTDAAYFWQHQPPQFPHDTFWVPWQSIASTYDSWIIEGFVIPGTQNGLPIIPGPYRSSPECPLNQSH